MIWLIKEKHEKEMTDLINKYKYSVLRLSKTAQKLSDNTHVFNFRIEYSG